MRPTLAGETIGALAVTEPGGGSDVAGIRTTAVRDGDHYVVNGAKTFITSGVRADFVTTAVRTGGPGHGGTQPARGREGHARLHRRPVAAPRWAGTARTPPSSSFVDVRVPVGNLVGEENTGFVQIAEQFVAERIALAVHGYGIAARALALTAAYCRERETFGRPLIASQVVRHRLVEMHRRVEVARTYTRDGRRARYVGGRERRSPRRCLPSTPRSRPARYVFDQAVQLHGGTGYMHGTEVERHYRDARILRHRRRSDRGARRPGRPAAGVRRMTTERTATAMLEKLAELDAEHAKAVAGGGEKYVDRHHARGKLLPASGSSCCSTRARRSWSCRPLAGWGIGLHGRAPAWSPASAWSRASSA